MTKIKLLPYSLTKVATLCVFTLLGGCNHSDGDSDADSTVTTSAFTFSAQVQHDNAAGSEYTITQPQSDLTLSGIVSNDSVIEVTVPTGVRLDYPLQVSVALNLDTYKYVSENVASLYRISVQQVASKRSNVVAYSETSNSTNTISSETTAQYALADTDQNGLLSDQELENKALQSTESDYESMVQDLMIAAQIANQDSSTLYYQTTYEMMGEFVKDSSSLSAFFAANSEAVASAKETLFGVITEANEEATSFLRLNSSSWPLKDQSLTYTDSPWACVDDIRRVSSSNYGIRLWHELSGDLLNQTLVNEATQEANASFLCKKSTWRLPTVTELSGLFSESTVEFPKTFPTMLAEDLYWATDENSNILLVTFSSGSAETQPASADATAKSLLHSFEAVEMWTNIAAIDTPVDVNELREVYSQPSTEWPEPTIDEGVEWSELGLREKVPFPSDNPYSEEKVALGKTLFFDTRLSLDNTVSCASCHDPEQGWADGIRRAVGINGQVGTRNTPTIINTAYYETLFLDGRVASLEEQSLHPISNPIEMGLSHDALLLKLDEVPEYSVLFADAFGDETITLDRIAKAIATFERTIISTESDFDKFLKGDNTALTDEQVHGLHLFRTKARCMNCHSGTMMTNNEFENIGLTYYGRSLEDRGRYNVTYNSEDMGKFRVQMLRDIKSTDPTTHLGLFKLATVSSSGNVTGLLAMYNNGMTRNRSGNFPQYAGKYDKNHPDVSPLIQRLQLTSEELVALDAFMSAISSEVRTDSATPEEMGIQ